MPYTGLKSVCWCHSHSTARRQYRGASCTRASRTDMLWGGQLDTAQKFKNVGLSHMGTQVVDDLSQIMSNSSFKSVKFRTQPRWSQVYHPTSACRRKNPTSARSSESRAMFGQFSSWNWHLPAMKHGNGKSPVSTTECVVSGTKSVCNLWHLCPDGAGGDALILRLYSLSS